jgi:hypothetical protein
MRRAVASGAFELLLLETINSVRAQHKQTPENAVGALDSLGFDVGQRLVEK